MIESITEDYYSQFCGVNLSDLTHGTYFVCSAERDAKRKGFGCKYAIYILAIDDLCVAAYSPRHMGFMEQLKPFDRDHIIAAVNQQFQFKKMQLMMFEKKL